MGQARAYADHLYLHDLDGFLQVATIDTNNEERPLKGSYITGQALDTLSDLQGKTDHFITPNSYYRPQRLSANIRQFRSLFIDLDLTKYEKAETVYSVIILAEQGTIPEPTMIIDSGRGVHLYWRIEHAPAGAAWTWQELEDFLYKQLKHLGADPKATDSARLLRLPGTINKRSGSLCEIIKMSDRRYSMRQLMEQYIKPKQKPKLKAREAKQAKGDIKYLFNPYTLHRARLDDLLTLCRLRNFEIKGQRNSFLHLFAYWQGITIRDEQALSDLVRDLNNSFKEPLKENEVNAVLRCIPKVVSNFLDPPSDTETGYNYRNSTLIDLLEIDEQEQMSLKTIISTKEKYRRNNKRRKKARRNEEGLTPRQQQAQEVENAILELRKKGLKQTDIAQELNITQGRVSQVLRKY